MLLLILTIETLLFAFVDKRIYGTYFTPVVVLAIPFLIILYLCVFFSPNLGFVSFYMPALWIWIVGLVFFWMPSLIIATFFKKKISFNSYYNVVIFDINDIDFLFKPLGFIVAVICLYGLISTYRSTGSFSVEEELATGFVAHAAVIMRLFVAYILIFDKLNKNNKIYIFTFFIGVLFSFAYTVKGWILIPLIAGLLGNILYYKKKINLKKIIFLPAFVFIVFYITYSLSFNKSVPLDFVFRHISFYFFSGILSLSEYVKSNAQFGISYELLFQPIFNFGNILSGQHVKLAVSDLGNNVGYITLSNVKTFFGTTFIYGGLLGGCLISFVWGTICYLFTNLSTIQNKPYFFLYYMFLLSALLMGWFDIYFNILSYYEFLFWCISLSVLYDLIKKVKFFN